MTYDPKDVPQFKQDICLKTCIQKGQCINEDRNDHWFLMCPHYHSWKLEYGSFVWDQLKYYREHPEYAEEQHRKNLEIFNMIKLKRNKRK